MRRDYLPFSMLTPPNPSSVGGQLLNLWEHSGNSAFLYAVRVCQPLSLTAS